MGMRQRVEPTDDWRQLQLLAPSPEQRGYELLRPVVPFGQSPTARARQTGTAERTLYRQVARFEREGMASLFPPPKVEKHRTLPPRIRQAILDLKAEHAAFSPHEIARICQVRFDRRPSPHTVKRILAESPPAPVATRRFSPYHRIGDPTERRLAVIRLHSEGRAVKSIVAYLQLGRRAVYRVLHRWIAEGVAGLEDKSHAHRGVRKVDLKAIATVKELQENPRLGAFRIHAALRRLGIFLSPPGALGADAGGSSRTTAPSTASIARSRSRTSRSRIPSSRAGGTNTGRSMSATSICTHWTTGRFTRSPSWRTTRAPSSPAPFPGGKISRPI
jgi:transposase